MDENQEEIIIKALAAAIALGTVVNPHLFSKDQVWWAISKLKDEPRSIGDIIDTAIAISEEG